MTLEYPWYAIVEGDELEQGDFIDDCDVVVPTYTRADSSEPYTVAAIVDTYNLIIVSQSCDLEQGKLDYVLMCPRWSYKEYGEVNEDFKKFDKLEQIRQGKQYKYCMLDKCDSDGLSHEIQIVDLGTVFSIPFKTVKELVVSNGKRLRLLSPYKEKLAQSFAYYYMRIALPNDITKIEKIKPTPQIS